MKAALGQLQLQWEDKEANLKLVETYMDLLAEKGTDPIAPKKQPICDWPI